jgi:hypothetical protein
MGCFNKHKKRDTVSWYMRYMKHQWPIWFGCAPTKLGIDMTLPPT